MHFKAFSSTSAIVNAANRESYWLQADLALPIAMVSEVCSCIGPSSALRVHQQKYVETRDNIRGTEDEPLLPD